MFHRNKCFIVVQLNSVQTLVSQKTHNLTDANYSFYPFQEVNKSIYNVQPGKNL